MSGSPKDLKSAKIDFMDAMLAADPLNVVRAHPAASFAGACAAGVVLGFSRDARRFLMIAGEFVLLKAQKIITEQGFSDFNKKNKKL